MVNSWGWKQECRWGCGRQKGCQVAQAKLFTDHVSVWDFTLNMKEAILGLRAGLPNSVSIKFK